MPIVFGLLASLLIGTSDFFGARSAGRTTALQSTTVAFLAGAVTVAVYSPWLGTPTGRDLVLGALSGAAALVALTTLWWAYARSSVGVAAPIAAVLSAVLPVCYDAARGEVPGVLGFSGVLVGAVALVMTSWAPAARNLRDGIVLGAVAGTAFAAMFLIAVESSPEAGTWPVVSQRATAFFLAVAVGVATRRKPIPDLASARWSVLAGMTGASGVASVVYAGQRHTLAPVVVSGSMYPAVVVTLAWLFMNQRMRAAQVVGLGAALLGVALIALD